MPDVPHGYDPVKLYHWLWWKLKCFEAQGTEFQQLFERVMPLVLGGDHSQAIGTIAGMTRHLRRLGLELRALQFGRRVEARHLASGSGLA